jgi:hypothetical protein
MGNSHIRPRDVSGESFLTVTNTLVLYILSLIYIRGLVYTVCHQQTRAIYIGSDVYVAS